jgi:hypothetical protein
MNELTEKILQALGLGLVGVIATIFLIINHRLKKRFVQERVKPEEPVKSIDLIGRWSGDGWAYTLKGRLNRDQALFEGQFEWTFQEFPSNYEHPQWAKKRLGLTGIEFVRGALTEDKISVSGYRADDPHKLGLLLGDYSIEIDEKAQSFKGTSINLSDKKIGSLTGIASVQR